MEMKDVEIELNLIKRDLENVYNQIRCLDKVNAEKEIRVTSLKREFDELVDICKVAINTSKNNLQRVHDSIRLASKIFGEVVTLQQVDQELTKLEEKGIFEIGE